jgi:hypothetical protein
MEPAVQAPPRVRWEWRAEYGAAAEESWMPYAEHDSASIEQAFQSGFSPSPSGANHAIDFVARVQRRLPDPSRASAERERPIRRVPDAPFPAVLVAEVRAASTLHTLRRPELLSRDALRSRPRARFDNSRVPTGDPPTGVGERDEEAVWELRTKLRWCLGPAALVQPPGRATPGAHRGHADGSWERLDLVSLQAICRCL